MRGELETELTETGSALPNVQGLRVEGTTQTNVAAAAFWITLDMLSLQGLSLVTFAVLAHFLRARDFGLVAIAFMFIYSAKTLTIDMIPDCVTRKPDARPIEYSTVFWVCVGLGVLGCGSMQLLSFFIDGVFHAPGLGAVLRPLSIIFLVFSVGRAQDAWLMRHLMFKTLAIRSVVGACVGAAVGVLAAIHHLGVWSLVLQQLVASTIALILLFSTTPWRPRFEFCKTTAREIGAFCRDVGAGAILGTINQNADTALVATFFGPATVGFYSVAKRLKLAIEMAASNPVTSIARPTLANAQDNSERLAQVFLLSNRILAMICMPVFMGAASVATPAIMVLFGSKWGLSGHLFGWLCLGSLCAIICSYANTLIVIKRRQSFLTWLSMLQTTVAFCLFVCLKGMGLNWVAAPFVFPYVIVLPATILIALKCADIRPTAWLGSIFVSTISALIMSVVVRISGYYVSTKNVMLELAILCLIGIFSYLICQLAFGRSALREFVVFLKLASSRK